MSNAVDPYLNTILHQLLIFTIPLSSLVSLFISMRGIQLQALLESKFSVALPDELMFEQDATLRTLATGEENLRLFGWGTGEERV